MLHEILMFSYIVKLFFFCLSVIHVALHHQIWILHLKEKKMPCESKLATGAIVLQT